VGSGHAGPTEVCDALAYIRFARKIFFGTVRATLHRGGAEVMRRCEPRADTVLRAEFCKECGIGASGLIVFTPTTSARPLDCNGRCWKEWARQAARTERGRITCRAVCRSSRAIPTKVQRGHGVDTEIEISQILDDVVDGLPLS
jgi:hypothetical protein